MRKFFILFISTLVSSAAFSQNISDIRDSLLAEGKRLYRSEMASWYGTDLFIAKYTNRENIGGYFSYTENDSAKCVFVSKADPQKAIGTVSFDSSYNSATALVDLTERALTATETEIFTIRTAALKIINSDTGFKTYQNTSLNLIPLISNGQKKVYVLTGPTQNGVVILGNDYLLNFTENNELSSIRQLHQNIIPMASGGENGQDVFGTMHSHLPATGEFITATDICTLMLYGKLTKWQQHIVISKNYVSIWNVQTNNLVILPKKDWEKASKKERK